MFERNGELVQVEVRLVDSACEPCALEAPDVAPDDGSRGGVHRRAGREPGKVLRRDHETIVFSRVDEEGPRARGVRKSDDCVDCL